MSHFEKQLSSEEIFDGRVFTVQKDLVQLEDDQKVCREVIRHNGGVCIAALDECDNLLMVRQFRYAMNTELLEIPAGKLEAGEEPMECGKRELQEETGYTAGSFQYIGKMYPSPAYLDEIIYIYLATDLLVSEQNLDDEEFLSVEKIPFDEAVEMMLSGQIPDAKTQVALWTVKHYRDTGRLPNV